MVIIVVLWEKELDLDTYRCK